MITETVTRGVRRWFGARDIATLAEFSPTRGLRADVFAVATDGEITIVEIKSGLADLRADHKWTRYLEWCDRFYFAVDASFSIDALDPSVGIIRADAFDAAVLRESEVSKLAPARRRSLLLKTARAAAGRLHRLEDPDLSIGVQEE